MPLTQAEVLAFFTEGCRVAIPQDTVNGGLMAEGIAVVQDLAEFNDDDFKFIQETLHKPVGIIVNPNDVIRRVPTHSYVFSTKSIKRLKIVAAAVRYYTTVGTEYTAVHIHFYNILF